MPIRTSTERKLLDAAEELFFAQGIRATSVDAVLERAGVSPATLYRGYPSKESLVAATLERRHRHWVQAWESCIERRTTPRARLLAVFDALDEMAAGPRGARWCAVLGTAAEYADVPDPIGQAVTVDTDELRSRLTELAAEVTEVSSDAAALAEDLLLVVTGHLAMRLRDASTTTSTARRVAAALIDAH